MNPTSDDGLQFDRAEYAGEEEVGAQKCTSCERELHEQYFTANAKVVCTECRRQVAELGTGGSGFSRFARASAFGIIGGAIGAAIYFAILKLTGYEVGLVAIVVGFLVGGGVRMGSMGRGGWRYQGLALAITYTAIVSTYVPFIIEGMSEVEEVGVATEQTVKIAVSSDNTVLLNGAPVTIEEAVVTLEQLDDDGAIWYYRENWATEEAGSAAESIYNAAMQTERPWYSFKDAGFTEPLSLSEQLSGNALGTALTWGLAFGLALFAPFLDIPGNLIGILIIGFALFEAWKMNRRLKVEVEGPFELAETSNDEAARVREA